MKRLFIFLSILLFSFTASSQEKWQDVIKQAQGQTVYFNAWGGSQQVNNYIQWAAQQLKKKYDINLVQVKVNDTVDTVSRLIAEKAAGKNKNGSIDLVWINGNNFYSLKSNHLLYGPFVERLPNWKLVNHSLPVTEDFSVPTDGYEAPWGVGQLVFLYDSVRLKNPPKSFAELLSYAKAFPGRVSYPKPPEFHGSSFLEAALVELTHNDPSLYQPVSKASFSAATKPLWQYLDQLHPYMWRGGRQFPSGANQMIQLLDDDQLDIAIAFNPNIVPAMQADGRLSDTVKAYAMSDGALTNVNFLAIPWNASAKAGALVAINFLMSPEAQSKKGDIKVWGAPAVIKRQYLTGPAKQDKLFKSISQPAQSWQSALEVAWQKRYGF
ncbi:ABC transporter substrate-binding protein [Vibrio sp. S4M6]|uniref:ABC transporter substrate-binding protein n=1 Tax=Vibrio sinus TaxID=2946865 RepID=UPI00202A0848|nr:ABC transporter substrate-binding protein [Vibrio sinus]MCL9782038.1 ABC transporter substrate-binding protein [Vibrio sinus]